MNKRKIPRQRSNYRTFEINGRIIIIDDFIYRRLFKDPDILPRRKYTFIKGFCLFNNCPFIVLKTKANKSVSLPRYIMHAVKSELVDHINRNPLDNRRCNLRVVNARQNMLNRKLKNNTGLISVSKGMYRKKYFCVRTQFINKEGHRLQFHCPDTPFNRILTALAHDKFVLQEGEEEYAPLNFPCWKYEPLRSILMKEDLSKLKERSKDVRNVEHRTLNAKHRIRNRRRRGYSQILRFCRRRAKRNVRQNKKLDKK